MVIAFATAGKLKQAKLRGLLEGSDCNKTHGQSLKECRKANTTHGDRPLRGF
jgi:hypothetical protein